jgi:hypothetical protein
MMSMRKKLFLGIAIIATGTILALIIATPRATPDDPLPNPNGYDDFIKAGTLLSGDVASWPEMSLSELRAMVTTNHSALELVRVGLTKQCRVIPYSSTTTTNNHVDDMVSAKRIGHAFAGASKLAVLDGQTNKAANLALDCIRYGNELARGGVVIDLHVGIADQYIGRTCLEEALPGTDAETSRQIVTALDRVINEREKCADVFKREAQWARRGTFGPAGFVTQMLQPILQRGWKAKVELKFARILVDLERAKLHAAARAYEVEHGQPPATVHDLVPHYLKSIPLNPTNGIEMQLN